MAKKQKVRIMSEGQAEALRLEGGPDYTGYPQAPGLPPQQMMMGQPAPMVATKKRWRAFTWVLLAYNVLGITLLIALGNTAAKAKDCGTLDQQTCQDATDIGQGIGMIGFVVAFIVIDLVLLLVWAITRPKKVIIQYR